MSDGQAAHDALSDLDRVLAAQPHKDDVTLSAATLKLCAYRDELIARRNGPDRTDPDRRRLDHLNAVISVVLGIHFPLGEPPWDELRKARGWLSDLLEVEKTTAS